MKHSSLLVAAALALPLGVDREARAQEAAPPAIERTEDTPQVPEEVRKMVEQKRIELYYVITDQRNSMGADSALRQTEGYHFLTLSALGDACKAVGVSLDMPLFHQLARALEEQRMSPESLRRVLIHLKAQALWRGNGDPASH